jgi:peptidyl-prolyl cis-trans isomerase C
MKSVKKVFSNGLVLFNRQFKESITCAVTAVLVLNISFAYAEDVIVDQPAKNEKIAASVNGVKIAMSALAPQVKEKLRNYKKYGMDQSNGDMQKFMRKQVLERLITVELLYQEAKNINIDDLDAQVSEALSKMEENQNKKEQQYDKKKMREVVTKKILIDEYLRQKKIKDQEVREEEILAYYKNNKQAFQLEERVRSRHILVSVANDAVAEKKSAANSKIKEALRLLQDGKEFADVAKDYSDCNTASAGGELGYHERGYMPKEYDDVAFSLEAGELSGIIETQHGYHIAEVLDHQQKGVQPYEEVKDFIAKYLKIENQKKAMGDHVSALRKKAKIDIYF